MNSKQGRCKTRSRWFAAAVGLVFLTAAAAMNAQVKTETTAKKIAENTHVKTERGTVILVVGNDLWVKDDAGQIKHFANIPESARGLVDGKEVGIHDLKPGMVLQRVTIKTTSDHLVTTVQTVNAKIWHINPPLSAIITLEDGTNHHVKIPPGQKFEVDGKMVDAWGLKKGMKVHITKVTEVPETRVNEQKLVAGQMPPPPPAEVPIMIADAAPVPAPAPEPVQVAKTEAPKALPKTGSSLPLIGLLGLMLLGSSFVMRLRRS